MASLIKICRMFLLLALIGGCCAREFRSDYQRNDRAGGWLKYHAEPATWDEARLHCHAEGSILASPLTEKLKTAIESLVQMKKGSDNELGVTIFIGVHATFSKGDYSSIEGVPLERLAITWASGEPDNLDNSERCLAMTIGYFGTMADTRCSRVLPYVCYKEDTGKKYRYDYEWSEQAGGWLKYHVVPATWEEAKPRCQAEGAVLASPLTGQLGAAIVAFVQSEKSFNEQGVTIFTGVQKTSDGSYSSVEGVSVQLQLAMNRAVGEPDNYINPDNCLAMTIGVNGTMADTSCDRVLPYVCYKKDSALTINECGTTDPEYKLDSRTGSCYKFHQARLPWSEAYMTCVAEGGYLAIINDDEEAEVIRNKIDNKAHFTLVGFHDWGHYGSSFMTIHGESLYVNYHRWFVVEPNNGTYSGSPGRGEYCGSIYADVSLNDCFCSASVPFLCEKMPNSLL